MGELKPPVDCPRGNLCKRSLTECQERLPLRSNGTLAHFFFVLFLLCKEKGHSFPLFKGFCDTFAEKVPPLNKNLNTGFIARCGLLQGQYRNFFGTLKINDESLRVLRQFFVYFFWPFLLHFHFECYIIEWRGGIRAKAFVCRSFSFETDS